MFPLTEAYSDFIASMQIISLLNDAYAADDDDDILRRFGSIRRTINCGYITKTNDTVNLLSKQCFQVKFIYISSSNSVACNREKERRRERRQEISL